jgi:YspA, cpYpsA-related SLOG family
LDQCKARHPEGLIVVHGACSRGPDRWAHEWCARTGTGEQMFPANWRSGLGKRAGIVRNQVMLDTWPDGVYAFCHRNSPGTTHCGTRAEEMGIPVWWCRT